MTPSELARLGAWVAERMDDRGDPHAGIVRQLARAVLTGPDEDEDVCRHCRGSLERKRRGRPRLYCAPACRRAAWRERNGYANR